MDKEKKNTEKKINVQNLIENLVRKAQIALDEMMKLNQEDIDKIVESMAKAGLDNHIKLAQMAVEETKKGIFEDKITKNIFATEYIYNDIKYKKTVGIIEENDEENYINNPSSGDAVGTLRMRYEKSVCRKRIHRTRSQYRKRSQHL